MNHPVPAFRLMGFIRRQGERSIASSYADYIDRFHSPVHLRPPSAVEHDAAKLFIYTNQRSQSRAHVAHLAQMFSNTQ